MFNKEFIFPIFHSIIVNLRDLVGEKGIDYEVLQISGIFVALNLIQVPTFTFNLIFFSKKLLEVVKHH